MSPKLCAPLRPPADATIRYCVEDPEDGPITRSAHGDLSLGRFQPDAGRRFTSEENPLFRPSSSNGSKALADPPQPPPAASRETRRSWVTTVSPWDRRSNPIGVSERNSGAERPHQTPSEQIGRGEQGAGERDPLTVNRCIDQHASVVEDRTVQKTFTRVARRHQPARPIAPVVQMQQGKLQHVFRLMQTAPRGQHGRAANRKEVFSGEIDRIELRPLPIAMPDSEVHIFPRKIDVVHKGCQFQLDLGAGLGKSPQPADEPFGGGNRRRADRDRARSLPLQQPISGEFQPVEDVTHHGEIVAPGLGNH